MAEDQIKYELGEDRLKKFTCLKFMRNGDSPVDARNQDIATVDFRIFAQSKDQDLLRMRNPEGFFRISMVNFLMSCRTLTPPSLWHLRHLLMSSPCVL